MKSIRRYYKQISITWKLKGRNLSRCIVIFRLFKWIIAREGLFLDFFLIGMHKVTTNTAEIMREPEFRRLQKKLNPTYYRCLLEDKYVFDRFFHGNGYPVAETLGTIENERIWWLDKNLNEPLENLVNHDGLDCFVKMYTSWGGEGVYKLVVRDGEILVNNNPCSRDDLKNILSAGLFVIQQRVIQHPELSRLNSSCVNTIRMITVHDGIMAHSFAGYLRIGAGTGHVDNIIQGGIGCAIHQDGRLFDHGLDHCGNHIWIREHPKSKVSFGSFVIPFYRESWDVCTRMHNTFHRFFIIGWDVAITATGPVIIEGNPLGGIAFEQILYGGSKSKILHYARLYSTRRGISL